MEPVRTIPIQSLSVSGKFPSRKNNRVVRYESQLELAFLYHLEFSPEVKSYVEQPCEVESLSGRHYIPDFLVFFNDPLIRPLLVEIKYASDLEKNVDGILVKLEALERFAILKGYDFKLFTDKELLTPRYRNYKFLYEHLSKPVPEELYQDLILDVISLVKRKQPIRVIDVASILGKGDLLSAGLYLSTIWHLIATSKLWVNIDEDLTNHSFVYSRDPRET